MLLHKNASNFSINANLTSEYNLKTVMLAALCNKQLTVCIVSTLMYPVTLTLGEINRSDQHDAAVPTVLDSTLHFGCKTLCLRHC